MEFDGLHLCPKLNQLEIILNCPLHCLICVQYFSSVRSAQWKGSSAVTAHYTGSDGPAWCSYTIHMGVRASVTRDLHTFASFNSQNLPFKQKDESWTARGERERRPGAVQSAVTRRRALAQHREGSIMICMDPSLRIWLWPPQGTKRVSAPRLRTLDTRKTHELNTSHPSQN